MSEKVLIIEHRGAKGHVTENILASIKKAIKLNVDTIISDFPDRL